MKAWEADSVGGAHLGGGTAANAAHQGHFIPFEKEKKGGKLRRGGDEVRLRL